MSEVNPNDFPQKEPPVRDSSDLGGKLFVGELTQDARTFGMLAHLLGLFTGFVGPLIIWLIKKDEHPFVDDQGKEALNFQITITIAAMIGGVTTLVCIGYFILVAVFILDLVLCLSGTVAANSGQQYRYPVTIRFIQ
jgi:uncharacterized Tic20 family protein